ncbi:MAG: GspE/PulE family protein [Candidatus Pacebacteria bacterium]|nr:GspE/PulE family protein [Candidatus Paceibacterota bacterium]
MSFLETVVQKNIISRNQLDTVAEKIEENEGDLDITLIQLGADEETLMLAKSEYYHIPFKKVDQQSVSFDLLKYVPEESVRHYGFVPIGMENDVVHIGIRDPENMEARNALQFIFGQKSIPFEIYLIGPTDFKALLETYRGITGQVDQAVSQLEGEMLNVDKEVAAGESLVKKNAKGNQAIVEDAPVTKMVAVVLRHAIEGRASDIHIENTGEKVKVRFRVDGALHTSLLLPKTVHRAMIARIKILSSLKLDEQRKPQDGRFFAKIEGRQIDFRVSTFPTYNGEKVAIRILDPGKGIKSLEETGMRDDHVKMVREAIGRPYGIILITGPTGSGKTSTLYSMINELDKEKHNVVSLEDPIEYNIGSMNQSQVMPEIGYTFANGLRSILRQDPDIIMVGEIRDKETAQLAVQAALTGHLVFSTLHTNNAIGVIPRLIDMGVDPYLIAPTLLLVMGQRLVRTIHPKAKQEMLMDGSIQKLIEREVSDLPIEIQQEFLSAKSVFEPKSIEECPSGMLGRTAVYEMFRMDRELEKIILEGSNDNELHKAVRGRGMRTMKEDAILKSIQGIVPFGEVGNL